MNRRQKKKLVRRLVEEMDAMTDDLRASLATQHAAARQARHAEMDRAVAARTSAWVRCCEDVGRGLGEMDREAIAELNRIIL